MTLISTRTVTSSIAVSSAPSLGLAETAQFFAMLEALSKAGVPLVRALDSLGDQPGFGIALRNTVIALDSGHTVSRSFALGGFRDPMVIHLLQLGERTGSMDKVINELATLFRWRAQLAGELRGRLTYPVILACSCALLLALGPPLLLRPILDFLSQSGGPLPAATEAMMMLVDAVSSPWFWVSAPLAAWLAGRWAIGVWARSPQRWERLLLSCPAVGPCLRTLYSVRFGKALLTGLSAGLPLLAGIELAARCSGSALVKEQGNVASAAFMAGDSPEEAFAHLEALDSLVAQSIPLGLGLGAVETMLGAVLRLSEERLRLCTDQLLALVEPVVLLFMGASVAFCVLATVSPMMSLLRAVA